MNVGLMVPDNWAHKAGDGVSTRKYHLKKDYSPALQARPESTQMSYVLEVKKDGKS